MNIYKKEEALKEIRDCFETAGLSDIKKAYYVLKLFVVLFDRRFIVIINIVFALAVGIGLNALMTTPWIVLISLVVNMLLVRYLLFGALLTDVDDDHEFFKIQHGYIRELIQKRRHQQRSEKMSSEKGADHVL